MSEAQMPHDAALEPLLKDTIPALFADPRLIADYGDEGGLSGVVASPVQGLGEKTPVAALSDKLARMVDCMRDADPRALAAKPSWLERLTGRALEREVLHQVASQTIESLMADAEGASQAVGEQVRDLDRLLAEQEVRIRRLEVLIHAGRSYLTSNPAAGVPPEGALEFDQPRQRFERRLANLATVQAAGEITLHQLRLTRAQSLELLDRFSETVRVLVPLWRQGQRSVAGAHVESTQVETATKAHQALKKSLAAGGQPEDKA